MKSSQALPIANKKGWSLPGIVFVIIIILGLLLMGGVMYNSYKVNNNECFQKVAEDYCEGNGMIYKYHYWDVDTTKFECYKNERNLEIEKFRFLDGECGK